MSGTTREPVPIPISRQAHSSAARARVCRMVADIAWKKPSESRSESGSPRHSPSAVENRAEAAASSRSRTERATRSANKAESTEKASPHSRYPPSRVSIPRPGGRMRLRAAICPCNAARACGGGRSSQTIPSSRGTPTTRLTSSARAANTARRRNPPTCTELPCSSQSSVTPRTETSTRSPRSRFKPADRAVFQVGSQSDHDARTRRSAEGFHPKSR